MRRSMSSRSSSACKSLPRAIMSWASRLWISVWCWTASMARLSLSGADSSCRYCQYPCGVEKQSRVEASASVVSKSKSRAARAYSEESMG
ncbi:hypothetical protein BCR44DRAFT_1425498, partial [Catenaria anguillulae PL171]